MLFLKRMSVSIDHFHVFRHSYMLNRIPYLESAITVECRNKSAFCVFNSIPYFKRMGNTKSMFTNFF